MQKKSIKMDLSAVNSHVPKVENDLLQKFCSPSLKYGYVTSK